MCATNLSIIFAGSLTVRQRWYAYAVTLSLATLIVVFTIILKASTLFIYIPSSFWKYLSGSILIALGLIYIFSHAWNLISSRLFGLTVRESLDNTQNIRSPLIRAIAMGAALGPVFSTCSSTYSLLLTTVFTTLFISGIVYTYYLCSRTRTHTHDYRSWREIHYSKLTNLTIRIGSPIQIFLRQKALGKYGYFKIEKICTKLQQMISGIIGETVQTPLNDHKKS